MDSPSTNRLPRLWQDRSFWGMSITQFLGAFNDNLFKQMVLLYCLDVLKAGGDDRQTVAQGLFALPFVVLSGYAGYLSDRNSKRTIVVLCKVAEIAVMGVGMLVLLMSNLLPEGPLMMLLAVLCLMGMQSAFFGPSKYGILPELFRDTDLPRTNAFIQMTTFLAIIFGTALAGYGKEVAGEQIWLVGVACVGIAILGTLTSCLVRPTPVAQPEMKFRLSALAINRDTARMLWKDRLLLAVLLISSLFWFIGGAVLPLVNRLGKDTALMQLGDGRTSILASCMGAGIAIGCIWAGRLSHNKINFSLVRKGTWGMVIFLSVAPFFSLVFPVEVTEPATEVTSELPSQESFFQMLIPASFMELGTRTSLFLVGMFAGFFAVPLQTFMQSRPPKNQKGQMIGAMNLINWIGILLSAIFLGTLIDLEIPIRLIFLILAALLVPVGLFFKPENVDLFSNHDKEQLDDSPDSTTEPNENAAEEKI